MASLLNRAMGGVTGTTTTEGTSTGTGSGSTGSITVSEDTRSGDMSIAATRGRTCAIRSDETVTCWGGEEGLLEHRSASGLEDVEALSTGNHDSAGLHTCAVHDNGDVSCWGPGSEGQLGLGDASTRYLPTRVPGITDAVAVAAGPSFTCVVHNAGGVSCWGLNSAGQLGDGTSVANRYWPSTVRGLRSIRAIAAGHNHTCAIDRDGDLWCWGGAYDDTPTAVRAPNAVSSASISGVRTCITTVDGLVYCWDYDATTASEMTRVGSITDAVKVSVGIDSACVLHSRGAVSCWGRNDVGQIGDGTTIRRLTPVRLSGISDAVDISVSSGSLTVGAHACALRQDGSVSCWGGNNAGQLGDGTLADGLTPGRVRLESRIPSNRIPLNSTELLLEWVDTVVANRGRDFPWLWDAWDHIRDLTSVTEYDSGGDVVTECYVETDDFGCEVLSMTITDMTLETVIHQLARVYDLQTDTAPRIVWGPVQLYFANRYPQCETETDQHGAEVLADTMLHLTVPHAYLAFYEGRGCTGLPRTPSTEAEEVVRDGLAGRTPDWYDDRVTHGDVLWTLWRRGPSFPALANLAEYFGGLCDTLWVDHPLDPTQFPAANTNPFKQGGC